MLQATQSLVSVSIGWVKFNRLKGSLTTEGSGGRAPEQRFVRAAATTSRLFGEEPAPVVVRFEVLCADRQHLHSGAGLGNGGQQAN